MPLPAADAVVGAARLPTFEDEAVLPYVRALVKEVLRWRPVAVLGGTLLLVWLLAWFGRRVGNDVGGTPWARGLGGAKIAVPYGVACWLLSFVFRASFPVQSQSVSVHAAYLSALLWPFAIALVATLPREQAESVMLRAVVGLDVASTAAALGKRPVAVRVAAHRGLKRLAAMLDDSSRP